MPVALIGMRPERVVTNLNTFWDWGIVYEFCPSKRLKVIGDSDEFLMMELRSKDRSINSMRVGRSLPKQISKRILGHITQYQLDNARFELRLHSRELPTGLEEAQRQLRDHVDEVLRHLPRISDHRWHRQWIYHSRHYRWRLERKWIRSRIERIASEIETKQSKWSKERELIDEYLSDENWQQALRYLEEECAANFEPLRQLECRLQAPIQPADWITRQIAGAPWVYRLSRRRLRNRIKEAADNRTLRVLAVCQPYSLLFGLLDQIPGCHLHLSPDSVLHGSLELLPEATPRFDLCIVELVDLEEPHVKNLLHALTGRLTQPGKIFVHWHDWGGVALESAHNQIVQLTLNRHFQARAWFSGSWASSRVTQILRGRAEPSSWRRLFLSAQVPALAFAAELLERCRKKPTTTMPKYCSSAVFEIEIPSRELVHAVEPGISSNLHKKAKRRISKTELDTDPESNGRSWLLPEKQIGSKF
jgi:hypothetical protein